MAYRRTALRLFSLANNAYIDASVSFYTIDADKQRTDTLATLYAAPTGSDELANPQRLDSEGKFKQPVYVEEPVVGVTGGDVESHETGIIYPSLSESDVQAAEDAATNASDSATLARDWAIETSGQVQGVDYSAKEYAQGSQAGTGGSAFQWAQVMGTQVDGVDYSAKAWAIEDLTPSGLDAGGSAKDWATETAEAVDGSEYAAKAYAQADLTPGGLNAGGSAKDWAIHTGSTVDGTYYSAKYHAQQAANNAGGVYISDNDTDLRKLGSALVAGSGVTLTEKNDGGDETLEVSASGASKGFAIAMSLIF